MFRTKWKVSVAAAVAVMLVLTGCSAESTPEPVVGGTLTIGDVAGPGSFDPVDAAGATTYPYYQAVYDSLLRAAPDGTIVPMLATTWTYNDDETVLTLELRDDVEFADGARFDAEVAKANLERYRDSSATDARTLAVLADVVVTGEFSLELHLSQPDPAFLVYLTTAASYQANPAEFDNPDLATVPAGTGPYILDQERTVVGSEYVYTMNPDYWDPSLIHYEEIVIKVLQDTTARVNALQSGQVDVASASAADRAVLEAAGLTTNRNAVNWFGLNFFDRDGVLNPALADIRVRQAIIHAIDTSAILQSLAVGDGTLTGQIFPTRSEAYDAQLDSAYPFDPEESRRLLAEAGYADGLSIDMASTSGLIDPSYFTTLQQLLGDVGITVTFTEFPVADYVGNLLNGNYPMALFLFGQATDWEIINQYITPNARWNVFQVEDPTVAALVNDVQFGGPDVRSAALDELNQYVIDNAWFGPWYRPDLLYFTNSTTSVEMQSGRAVPYIYNYSPIQ
ncbi:MAG: peptide ABC transporter substrate-binding protein [Cryobacterium sp.]|nr:peptide ABC transporter substrate-binding protein [Cryobacterium sp.]